MIWRIVVAMIFFSATLDAQTVTRAEVDSLKARIDFLERFVGTQFVGKSSGELAAALTPANTLPGGRYPIFLSDYQIRVGIAGVETRVAGVSTRLSVVESAAAGGQPVGTAVFDKIRVNQICVGDYDCDPDWMAKLQVRTNGTAFIGGESNLNGSNPQSPHSHTGQFSIGGDGGIRIDQNCKMTYSQGFKCYIDPCREWTNIGTDSRGSWSYYRGGVIEGVCSPAPHDGTQDFVLTTDEGTRNTVMYLWRPNWGLTAIGSSCIRCMDKPQMIVPKQ